MADQKHRVGYRSYLDHARAVRRRQLAEAKARKLARAAG